MPKTYDGIPYGATTPTSALRIENQAQQGDNAVLAELRRLQDDNENLTKRADMILERYEDIRRECRQLQKELAERPPIHPKPSVWRRFKYLFTGR